MQSRQNGDEDKPRGGPLLASQLHSLTAGKAGGKAGGKSWAKIGGKSWGKSRGIAMEGTQCPYKVDLRCADYPM